MPSGRVRWFDANKGYGFIQTGESTDDVFLPAAALPAGDGSDAGCLGPVAG